MPKRLTLITVSDGSLGRLAAVNGGSVRSAGFGKTGKPLLSAPVTYEHAPRGLPSCVAYLKAEFMPKS